VLNWMYGDKYAVGYKHFRRDHHTTLNILGHLVCLGIQLSGNFGTLFIVDSWLGWPVRILSLTTALAWSVSIMLGSGAPTICNVFSVVIIFIAHFSAPFLDPAAIELCGFGVFFLLFLVAAPLNIEGKVSVPLQTSVPRLVFRFGGWIAIWTILSQKYGGVMSAESRIVGIVYMMALVVASTITSTPTVPAVIVGMLGGRLAYVFTNNPLFFFFSIGFLGSFCQGESHSLTHEVATLLQLERGKDPTLTIGYQYSHVTFFPVLLLHSCYESFVKA